MLFSKLKREPLLWSLLAITVFLQWYRLGIGELIAWDESLYIIRAKAILEFGVWLDQTPYALGGLYSSTHPPLAIWLMAIFARLFGETLFVWRLVSALSAVAGIFFLYKLSRKYATERAALIAAIALGNAQQYLWYAHHAQLDIPLHASVLAVVWLTIRALRTDSLGKYLMAGIILGVALLVKAFQGLYVLPMIAGLVFLAPVPRKITKIIMIVGTGVLLALPWYILIVTKHSLYLADYSSLAAKISSGAYDSGAHQWWYYFNQLIVALPLFFPLLSITLMRQMPLAANTRRVVIASLGWLAIMLALLTVMGTKMPHFLLFAVVPSVIILPVLVDLLQTTQVKRKGQVFFILFSALSTLWSMGLAVRNPRMFFCGRIEIDFALLIAIVFPVLVLAYIGTRKELPMMRSVLLLLAILVGGNLYRWTHWKDSAFVHGAAETAHLLDSIPNATKILLLHSGAEFEDLHAELSYYSNGWMLNWRPDRSFASYSWFEAADSAHRNNFWNVNAVVIQQPWDAFTQVPQRDSIALAGIADNLRQRFIGYRRIGRYVVFY